MGQSTVGYSDITGGMAQIRGPHADVCEGPFLIFLADYHLLNGDIKAGLEAIKESRRVASECFAESDRMRIEGELIGVNDAEAGERVLWAAIERAREQHSPS